MLRWFLYPHCCRLFSKSESCGLDHILAFVRTSYVSILDRHSRDSVPVRNIVGYRPQNDDTTPRRCNVAKEGQGSDWLQAYLCLGHFQQISTKKLCLDLVGPELFRESVR